MPRHSGVDGLRGVAILAVIVFHFGGDALRTTDANAISRTTVGWGWIGVDLFFVLSGFLITDILLRTRNDAHYFRNFWGRRVLRIVPAYFVTLVVVLHGVPGLELAPIAEHEAWLWTFSTNIWVAMHHGVWGFASTSVDLNHTWSLAIEEQFYLAWPIVVYLLHPRSLQRLAIAILVASLVLRAALILNDVPHLTIYTLTPTRLDGLLCGALVAMVRPTIRPTHLAAAGVAVILLFGTRGVDHDNLWVSTLGFTLVALASATLLTAGLDVNAYPRLGRILASRPLIIAGRYSYGVYLAHGVLRPWTATLVANADLQSTPALVAFSVLLGGCASLLVAMASFHVIEARVLKLKDLYFSSP